MDKKIVLIAGKGESTNIVFNSLNKEYKITLAILEDKESNKVFLKRRIKRLGWLTVIGQVFFQVLIAKPLAILSEKRKQEIKRLNHLDSSIIPKEKVFNTYSINSQESIQKLKEINPDLIIVNGTRIISKRVLNAVSCKFINTHAGITPKYRGVHGMYWAIANNDVQHSGVTVHFVDEGIDTGKVLYQSIVQPTQKDNFSTYPLLQLSVGLKILSQAVTDVLNNRDEVKNPIVNESKLWYHPTIWTYIVNRLKGVK